MFLWKFFDESRSNKALVVSMVVRMHTLGNYRRHPFCNQISQRPTRFYSVTVITLDFESSDPGSTPGRTLVDGQTKCLSQRVGSLV